MASTVFTNPVFCRAAEDIQALGVRINDAPHPEAIPYGIVGGRSNSRWWLIPLTNRHIAASGMAMFQPILPSARLMKHAAVGASRFGLSALWARNRVYLEGDSTLSTLFGQDDLHYAYFTGTDSPHRKAAIQVMDAHGHIKGFAKVSRTPTVEALLAHEADVLTQLAALNLQTAHLPSLLYSGERNGAHLLVTDTLKTAKTKTVTALKPQHLAFLQELAQNTTGPQDGRTVNALKRRYAGVANRLAPEWRHRFEQGLARLETSEHELLPPTLTHGDFTPWNTFFVDGALYVFDWEYAETDYPASNDLFHFLLATPGFRNNPPEWQVRRLAGQVTRHFGMDEASATDYLIVYLLSHTLRYVERLGTRPGQLAGWEGERENAALLDTIYRM